MSTVIGTNSRGGIAKSAKNASSKASNRTGIKTSTASSTPTNNATQLSSLQSQLSSKIQEAKNAGLNTSKAESFLGSSYAQSSMGNVKKLGSESLATNPPWMAPTTQAPSDPGNISAAGNAGIATGMDSMTLDQNGLFKKIDTGTLTQGDALRYALENAIKAPNTEDIATKSKEYKDVGTAQKELNNQTALLNDITAKRDQAMLALEGQGRGQTAGFIGGEQARINREAAIQALPIQAAVAIAQGNLDYAQKQFELVTQLRLQDAQYKYQTEKDKLNSIVSFLDKSETRQYNEKMLLNERTYNEKQKEIEFDRQKQLLAIKNQYDIQSSGGELNSFVSQAQGVLNGEPTTTKAVIAGLLGNKHIQAGTKGRIAPALAVLNSVDEISNMNLEGGFTGIGIGGQIKEGIKSLFNMKATEATTNEQNIQAINLKVQQWASGASLTEQQTKQVNELTPTKWDSDKTVRNKMNGLYNFMLNQVESDLLTDGVNIQFPPVNLFEIKDLYDQASPEQKRIIEQTYFGGKSSNRTW